MVSFTYKPTTNKTCGAYRRVGFGVRLCFDVLAQFHHQLHTKHTYTKRPNPIHARNMSSPIHTSAEGARTLKRSSAVSSMLPMLL